ncbi:MAG: hypothetical protein MJZ19_09035 [Paludibacteraceae bacterium]|nr:hypothetical protein [Paludibacteraceae bacterium]
MRKKCKTMQVEVQNRCFTAEFVPMREYQSWLIDEVTEIVHNSYVEGNEEFNNWAKNFEREEAEFEVNMEFCVDYMEDDRTEIPMEEAKNYLYSHVKTIIKNWYI